MNYNHREIAKHRQPRIIAKIRFCHPGYRDTANDLLVLPQLDGSAKTGFGVHCGTAHTACAIIAGNAFRGYFELDATGKQRVNDRDHFDAVLTEPVYYFFVDDGKPDNYQYPVVPSFRDWEFPLDKLPWAWTQASERLGATVTMTTTMTKAGSGPCALTRFTTAVEENKAHIIPRHEHAWFAANAMRVYGTTFRGIDDTSNAIPLRRDVRFVFDECMLVVVPKRFPKTPPPLRFVGHMLADTEYSGHLHNTAVQHLAHNNVPLLFSHFARAVLAGVHSFITAGHHRHVLVRHARRRRGEVYEERLMTGAELRNIYGGDGGGGGGTWRNATPFANERAEHARNLQSKHIPGAITQSNTAPLPKTHKKRKYAQKAVSSTTVKKAERKKQKLKQKQRQTSREIKV